MPQYKKMTVKAGFSVPRVSSIALTSLFVLLLSVCPSVVAFSGAANVQINAVVSTANPSASFSSSSARSAPDASSSSSSSADGFVIMFHCIQGCLQNLTEFGRSATNAQMTWGINESSYGGYSGGFTYNPQCFTCNPYTGNGYEYPYANYQTYTTQPLGVFSSRPYVNIFSVQFEVAYPGVGNHIFTQGQYPLTIEVDTYNVSASPSNTIFTSNPSGRPFETSYITVYPTTTFSCGGFEAPSDNTISFGASSAPLHSSYIVQPGDTLYSIGLLFGVPWQNIALANNIAAPYTIYPGESLTIPTTGLICYAVQSGDYLAKIGHQFNVPWQSIASVNKISYPYTIHPGEQLIILSSMHTYSVKPGDYLYKIGQQFGVPWQSIAFINGIVSPYTIYPGEILVIP